MTIVIILKSTIERISQSWSNKDRSQGAKWGPTLSGQNTVLSCQIFKCLYWLDLIRVDDQIKQVALIAKTCNFISFAHSSRAQAFNTVQLWLTSNQIHCIMV